MAMAASSLATSPAAHPPPIPVTCDHLRPRTRAPRSKRSAIPVTCDHHQFLVPPAMAMTSGNPHPSTAAAIGRRSSESAAQATTAAGNSSSSSKKPSSRRKKVTLKLTYLEINGWVWEVHEPGAEAPPLRVLVDPIAAGNLDFGMPWLYDGAKKHPNVRAMGVDDLLEMKPDVLLITSNLDDHCHARTLARLAAAAPDLPVVAAPSAARALAALQPAPSFRRVTYLAPGQSAAVGGGRHNVRLLAAPGPVWGPPWQCPENAYVLFAAGEDDGGGLIYYEPHCAYDRRFLERNRLRAEVVITPVVKQILPGNLALVSGQEDAVELAALLRARYVVPMNNGDLDAGGLLAGVITTQGTAESFKAMMAEALPEVQVPDATPGVPLCLEL